MKIQFTKRAKRDVEALEKPIIKRIKAKLQWYLGHDDPLVFADKLTEFKLGHYRYRIGNHRVIFDVDGVTMIILAIGHRKEIYR